MFKSADDVDVFYLAGTTGWGALYGGHRTRLTTGDLDPLIGGLDLVGFENWFVSGWFGPYSTAFAPWLFHIDHGFIYRYPESTNESMYFYDNAMGAWWWTRSDIYTYIFAFDPPADNAGTDIDSAWLRYQKDTKNPRSFRVTTGDHAWATSLYFDP